MTDRVIQGSEYLAFNREALTKLWLRLTDMASVTGGTPRYLVSLTAHQTARQGNGAVRYEALIEKGPAFDGWGEVLGLVNAWAEATEDLRGNLLTYHWAPHGEDQVRVWL